MALLDQGPETVRVFPSTWVTDGYGTRERRPAATGIVVPHVFMVPGVVTSRTDPKYAEDTGGGQQARLMYSIIGPDTTRRGGSYQDLRVLDPWAEIEWPVGSGRRFDVNGEITHHTYPQQLASYIAQLVGRGKDWSP